MNGSVTFNPWKVVSSNLNQVYGIAYHSPKFAIAQSFPSAAAAQRVCDRLNVLEQECPYWMLLVEESNSRIREAIAHEPLDNHSAEMLYFYK